MKRLDIIHRPKIVLDLKGLVYHAYFGVSENWGRTVARGVEAFWERYALPIFQNTPPIDVVAALEGGSDLRKAIFPDYKANRQPFDAVTEKNLQATLDSVTQLLLNLGCTTVEVPKVEADDVISMICKKYPGKVTVYTRDMDLVQLADLPNSTVLWMDQIVTRDTLISDSKVDNLRPRQIRLYKALCGDPSDNYGGVYGFGPKKWQSLVEHYGDSGLAELGTAIAKNDKQKIVAVAEKYQDKALQLICEQWDQARMCMQLAMPHAAWCWRSFGGELLRPAYRKRLPLRKEVVKTLKAAGCSQLIEQMEHFLVDCQLGDAGWVARGGPAELVAAARRSPAVGFDTETFDRNRFENLRLDETGGKGFVDVLSQQMTGASFAYGENLNLSVYVPLDHRGTQNVANSALSDLVRTVHESTPLVAHNAQFERRVVRQDLGVEIDDWEDSITWASYFNEELMEGHNGGGGLKELSSRILGYRQTEYSEVLAAAGAEDMRGVSGEEVLAYGCDDALVAAHLWVLFTFSVALEGQSQFVVENDTYATAQLANAFTEGIAIDKEEVAKQEAADDELIATGWVRVKEELTARCTEVDDKAALDVASAFFDADREWREMFLRNKFPHIKSEKLQVELKTWLFKLKEKVKYVPPFQVKKPVEFAPTPAKLNEVIQHLGGTHMFAAVNLKQVKGWLESNLPKIEPGSELDTFASLLGAAVTELKGRDGEDYRRLHAFCIEVLERHAKKEWAGDVLNPNSAPQMQELLYLKLGLPVRVRSKVARKSFRDAFGLKGAPSSGAPAIAQALADDCPEGDWRRPILKTLLDLAGAHTRKSGVWRWPLWVRPDTGKVHPHIKNNGTVTRRPSGGSPNGLAFDKGDPRKIIVPRAPGRVIVSIDFSGQELRIIGSESRDPVLFDAYEGGGSYIDEDGMERRIVKDIHSVTSCAFGAESLARSLTNRQFNFLRMTGDKLDYGHFLAVIKRGVDGLDIDASPEDKTALVKAINQVRKMAKVVNFLICYLGTYNTLAQKLMIPTTFAEQIMTTVFSSYPRLGPWQSEKIKEARERGFVRTAYGTWKHVSPDILSREGGLRSRAERQAVNQVIQGCAADILKVVLTESHHRGVFSDPRKAVLLLPLYDEIVADVAMDYCFEYVQTMQDIMNVTPPGHSIRMLGEVSIGRNWGDQVEFQDRPSERKINALFDSWRV